MKPSNLTFILFLIAALFCLLWFRSVQNCAQNTTTTTITNNCDTLYQVINVSNPQMNYTTPNKPSNLMRNYGFGANLGYVQNFGLNYGLDFRYKNVTFGGVYYPSSKTYGVKVGIMFDRLQISNMQDTSVLPFRPFE